MVSNVDDNMTMIDLFCMELETHSLKLEQGITGCGATPSREQAEPLMRAAHSIRGAARIVGLDGAARLAQAMEELFISAQDGSRLLAAADLNAVRAANDYFRRLAACSASDVPQKLASDAGEIDKLIGRLQAAPIAAAKPELPEESAAEPAAAPPVDLSLLDLFRTELEIHSRSLEEGLVETEASLDSTKIQTLMRAAHSLKGAARILGFDLAVQLAHAMEDMLSAAQRGQRQLTSADFDLLLRATDVFGGLARHEPGDIPEALAQASGQIDELVPQFSMEAPPAASVAAPPAPIPPGAMPAPKPQPEKLEIASVRVSVENLNRLTGFAGECMVQVKTLHPFVQTVQRIKQRHSGLSLAIEQAQEALGKESIVEAQTHVQDALLDAAWIHAAIPAYLNDLERFSRKLDNLANRMYDEAVASRMRPFSDGMHGFHRMVRDLAKSLGKKILFEIEGDATLVDRDILEKLEAPLTHLLRNAVDHGIETPESRALAKKPPEAKLTLSARHVAGVLEIVVADDGGGIDPERIRQKIADKGFAAHDMAQKMSDSELLEFLFLPGFSTMKKVTEISGRGVGLDIVQSMARQVGGNARIRSKLGEGTRMVMQLPLTLSVLRALLFEIKGQTYSIPLTRVDRILRISHEEVLVVEDRQYVKVGDQNVGLIEAAQVLALGKSGRQPGDLHIMMLSDRLNHYGLVVDRFVGQRDLVVIPLPARLGKVPNISAGAILENGSPVSILDSEDLVRSIDNLLTQGQLMKLGQKAVLEKDSRKRVLVVDDSLTVREVERRLLENRGYEVTVAVDGMDAWNIMQGSRFNLVVTDVDMPRMDGIELVRRIKSSASMTSIPVMIVSYKDQDEYRIKGLEEGASYYLTKSSFHDEKLIDAVRDLIGEAV